MQTIAAVGLVRNRGALGRAALGLGFGLLAGMGRAETAPAWTDRGAEFARGTLGNSGQNLYLNRRGELETIRRYDLDGNGYLDLVFNCSHDSYGALPATLVQAAAGRSLTATEIALDGSAQVVAADLNRDGFTDLVFAPSGKNVQEGRDSVKIAWGGPDGWNSSRLTRQLPGNDITEVAVGDLNGDGWPDLLVLNGTGWMFGQPAGRILRIYWGGPDGFLLTRYQDMGIAGALKVVTGRFGPGGREGAAVLTETGSLVFLAPAAPGGQARTTGTLQLPLAAAGRPPAQPQCLLAQPSGGAASDILWIGTDTSTLFCVRTAGTKAEVEAIAASPATHLALGRLDDDAWPDMVLTNEKLIDPLDKTPSDRTPNVSILWGGPDGFDRARATALWIPNATAAAVGDLDGDGHGDLVVAVHQGVQTTQASSWVFFGDGSRRPPSGGRPVATEGAADVVLARLAPSARPVAVFANAESRTLDDAVPIRVYWGSAEGFSSKARVDIPNLSGYKSCAADLNSDGYVDLMVANGVDVSADTAARAPSAGVNIYWGGPEGSIRGPGPTRFDPARRLVLPEKHVGSINVADLNHDGYLDIVIGEFEPGENQPADLVIYYGSGEGYLAKNRKVLHVPDRTIGCLIADFNKDGYLDIVIGCANINQVITYWGGPDGYSDARKSILPFPQPVDVEAADLNNNGWLDLLVSSYEDPIAHHRDTGLAIYWGGPLGWRQSNSQWLPSGAALGLAVADLDGDGFLDIVAPNYLGELSREHLPAYIFWGSATGYAPLRRTTLNVDSGSEAVIADFDREGKLDVMLVAHSVDAGHRTESPIYFNDGHRFRAPRVQYLPANGAHYMWVQDIGNIYTRRYEEDFVSRAFGWNRSCRAGTLTVDARQAFGSRVHGQVRSAPSAAALAAAPWRDLAGGAFTLSGDDRALQYRLALLSANGDAYPVVRQVGLQLQ